MFNVDGATLTLTGTGTIQSTAWVANAIDGGVVIIEGGNYISEHECFKAAGNGSKIEMNNGHIISQETAFSANTGATIIINDGLIVTTNGYGISTSELSGEGGNGITINGGTIDANNTATGFEACAVYIANNDSFVMNGGEIIGNNGAGICMRGGQVEINTGATITATGTAGTTGKIGTSETLMTKSAIIYHESADYPGKSGMTLTVNDGTITGVDHSIEVLSNEVEPQVVVTGGTLTPTYPESVSTPEPEEPATPVGG